MTNRRFLLARRPVGMVTRDDFELSSTDVPGAGAGEFVVQTRYISLDPAMRGWMNEAKSYVPPVAIGDVMRAGAVSEVIESRNERFAVGDKVVGMFGVQEYALSDGAGVQKVDPAIAPLPAYLGVLGMPGMTAYFGLFDVGAMKDGETVVVSGAAGAVGSVVGQLAKIRGGRAVGIAGGPDKCKYVVDELGFDACIDYKSDDVKRRVRELCPDGVDVYFDNVGGDILDAVLTRLARGARVVICGAISQYNATSAMKGPANYMSLLVNRARMEGFLVFDYAHRYKEAAQEMGGWVADGRLKHHEDIEKGFERFPEVLQMLFRGENLGKLVLAV